MYLISACLCGVNCRYNGKSSLCNEINDIVKEGRGILVCPEQLGGLETPRVPCEIKGDINDSFRILNKNGEEKTEEFLRGAREVVRLAKRLGIKKAILKESSPSCGSNFIYNGEFKGEKIAGMGLTTFLLRENGVEVFSEDNFRIGEME